MEDSADSEIVFKWTNSCRLCLSSTTKVELFCGDANALNALETIKNSLNLLVYEGDPLPRKLCSNCLEHLDTWALFKKQCIGTENQLKERLHPYKKIDFVQKYFDDDAAFKLTLSPKNVSCGMATLLSAEKVSPSSLESSEKLPPGNTAQPVLEPADSTNLLLDRVVIKTECIEVTHESLIADDDCATDDLFEPAMDMEVDCATAEIMKPEPTSERFNSVNNEQIESSMAEACDTSKEDPQYNLRPRAEVFNVNYEDVEDWLEEAPTPPTKKRLTPWKCIPCNIYLSSKLALKIHNDSVDCKGIAIDSFTCTACRKLFFSQADLARHQVYHVGIAHQATTDDLIGCSYCDLLFADPLRLLKHNMTHSVKKRPVRSKKQACPTCGELVYGSLLEEHTKTHLTTDITLKSVSDSITTRSSSNSSPAPPVKEVSCSLCPSKFSTEDLLYDHRFAFHGIPDERVTCETCGLKFRGATALEEHAHSHNPKSVAKKSTTQTPATSASSTKQHHAMFRCKHCGHLFPSADALTRHESTKHRKRIPLLCRMCPRRFSTRTFLLLHQRTHSFPNAPDVPDEQLPEYESPPPSPPIDETLTPSPAQSDFCCEICDIKFHSSEDLGLHTKAHNASNNMRAKCVLKKNPTKLIYKYQCSHCPQIFCGQGSAKRHRLLVHNNEVIKFSRLRKAVSGRIARKPEPKLFKCTFCDQNFTTVELRKQHTTEEHSIKKEVADVDRTGTPTSSGGAEKNVSCQICLKSFSHQYIWKHLRKVHHLDTSTKQPKGINSSSEGIKCRFCDRTCKTKSNLARHENTHRTAGAQCKDCGFQGNNVGMLQIHRRRCPMATQKVEDSSPKPKPLISVPNPSRPSAPPQTASRASSLGACRICPICLNSYETPNLLELHVMTAHGSEAFERLQHPVASLDSPMRARLPEMELWKEEQNKIVRTINGIHLCTLCRMEFASYQAVTWHRSQHPRGNLYIVQIGDSAYQCTVCDRMFSARQDALQHTLDHTEDHDVKPFLPPPPLYFNPPSFKCPFCSSTFTSADSIRNHIFYVHPEGSINAN